MIGGHPKPHGFNVSEHTLISEIMPAIPRGVYR
jgi:hypothetical protein